MATKHAPVHRHSTPEAKIALFRALFRGRDDVYPRRFESRRTGKSGYQPACANAWARGLCAKHGTGFVERLGAGHTPRKTSSRIKCSECPHRRFLPVTNDAVRWHLSGQDGDGRDFVMGVYPMLQDETCFFLAADFDKSQWQEDVGAVLDTCRRMGLPPAVERSRSGHGGHVWLFFAEAVPAASARRLGSHILTETMERRPDIGLDSYDRLFPNQDTLPQGGLGNLIALPLQKQPRDRGDSVFLDEQWLPYADQWAFLSTVARIDRSVVDDIVRDAERCGRIIGVRFAAADDDDAEPWTAPPSRRRKEPPIAGPLPERLELTLGDQIYIAKGKLPPGLRNRLLRLAAFQNPEFYKAQAMRLPTYDKPRIIGCAEDHAHHIGLPRGCLEDLQRLQYQQIKSRDSGTSAARRRPSGGGLFLPGRLTRAAPPTINTGEVSFLDRVRSTILEENQMGHARRSAKATRRQFLQQSGSLVAGAALVSGIARSVHAGEDNTIRLALLGCGSRGSGAVRDALSVPDSGPIKLYAMADLTEAAMSRSHKALAKEFEAKVDVPEDRKFLGFDAYRKAIDLLRPGDIAMCTTRAYIRPVHVEYAVKKGINVFMEKPFAPDPGGLHRLLRAGEEAEKKGVKIAAGLQCRHSPARKALLDQIHSGAMGDITLIRANRLGGAGWLTNQGDKSNDLMNQLQFGRIHLYWIGSGHMVDYLIHQIDECCWIKDAWPVSATGFGGRVPDSKDCGQNIDVYSIEYTFADGTKAFCGFRRIKKTRTDFATYIHGTKCAAQFSGDVHKATVHRFKDQRIDQSNIAWTPEKDAFSPWQYEWNNFIASIRNNRPHNEAKRAAYSDLTTLMGRAACHTGQTVTWDEMMNSKFQFCDYLDNLKPDSPAPCKADENGQFPVPVPGQWTEI